MSDGHLRNRPARKDSLVGFSSRDNRREKVRMRATHGSPSETKDVTSKRHLGAAGGVSRVDVCGALVNTTDCDPSALGRLVRTF